MIDSPAWSGSSFQPTSLVKLRRAGAYSSKGSTRPTKHSSRRTTIGPRRRRKGMPSTRRAFPVGALIEVSSTGERS